MIFLLLAVEDISPAAPVHSEDGKSALHAAASKGHLDVLVVLVYKVGTFKLVVLSNDQQAVLSRGIFRHYRLGKQYSRDEASNKEMPEHVHFIFDNYSMNLENI